MKMKKPRTGDPVRGFSVDDSSAPAAGGAASAQRMRVRRPARSITQRGPV